MVNHIVLGNIEGGDIMENKRVYQVAKEFNVSSEALLSMLKDQKFTVKSHMSIVDDSMFKAIKEQFDKQQDKAFIDILKKKKRNF